MPEHDNGASPGSVKFPEHLSLAAALVLIATGDYEALHIPAGRGSSKAQCILDGDGLSFRADAGYYIEAFRQGMPRHLRPGGRSPKQEVEKAEEELREYLEDGCLYAWLDGKRLQVLKWDENAVLTDDGHISRANLNPVEFFACHQVSLERADAGWPWFARPEADGAVKPAPESMNPSTPRRKCGTGAKAVAEFQRRRGTGAELLPTKKEEATAIWEAIGRTGRPETVENAITDLYKKAKAA
jgi:hypothetical protein